MSPAIHKWPLRREFFSLFAKHREFACFPRVLRASTKPGRSQDEARTRPGWGQDEARTDAGWMQDYVLWPFVFSMAWQLEGKKHGAGTLLSSLFTINYP